MTRTGDVMVARRENIRHSFAFRAVGGDDHTMSWRSVEVIEPPQLESLGIKTYPPKYTGLPAAFAQLHLQVLAGSGIELQGAFNEPITAARILLDGGKTIEATIRDDSAGNPQHAFHIAPEQWIAAESSVYRLQVTDSEGLAIDIGEWNLRVEPDPPPGVSWQKPTDDLLVTPAAVVPIELAVTDNLAVQRVELNYERSDRSEAERERQPAEPPIELYRGPETANVAAARATADGDSLAVDYAWDLAPLKLPIGAQLTVNARAADYRPAVGRTVRARHITIITAEELATRLANRQAQIVRQLERALAAQRATREEVRRLEIDVQGAGVGRDDRSALQAAELNQQRVGRMLVDPLDGVMALIEEVIDEVKMNRLTDFEPGETLSQLAAELDRLASGPLDVAQRELVAVRKSVESSSASKAQSVASSLSAAGAAQDEVVAALNRLVNELSDKADYLRFARLLAELRDDQLAHQEASRVEIGLGTLPLSLNELSGAQRANLNKAAAGQSALAARLEKIDQDMNRLVRDRADDQSEAAGTLTDSLMLARRLAIGVKMHQAARDFGENRVGQALAQQAQIADDLQQVLDMLRRREERRPEQLVDNLRDAEQRLAELREQLAALRQQIAQVEQQPAGRTEQNAQQLHSQQQALRRDIAQLARQLERLGADEAGRQTQSAANRLGEHDSTNQQPSSSQQVQQAEQDLEDAARQLAARRQQAEDDLALEFVRRFQHELGGIVEQQKKTIDATVDVDQKRREAAPPTEGSVEAIAKLAAQERHLAEKSREHGELLFGLGAVRISLEDAERRLNSAAALLEQDQTGDATQQAERHALARLEGMMQAFEQTANEAGQNQQPGAGDSVGGDQPQRRPTFELLEVKMLRMLQADLHERTTAYEQRVAGRPGPPDAAQRVALDREAKELATEQGRLAELVQNMLTRDNEQ
jgi:hypothetical protein